MKMRILLGLILMANVSHSHACQLERSYFISAIVKVEGELHVWINTRHHWESFGYLTDSYTSSERRRLAPILKKVGLCELAESVYESCPLEASALELKQRLELECVSNDSSFQAWAEQF
jgi:hypothetical protein